MTRQHPARLQITMPATTPLTMHTTSIGYEFFRSRYRDSDETVYVHHLLACLDHDPHEVFGDHTVVQLDVPIPWYTTPENVDLVLQSRQNPNRHEARS
jgi:hypothetical protein